MIAFHFPPQAASSGIQRTLSFSKYLPQHDWEPIILSANPMAYEEKNASQLSALSPALKVRRTFALDAKRHLGVGGRYPEAIALPDRWSSWFLSAVPAGLCLIRRHQPKVLWSTFPIASAHLIGLTLQRITKLPWIADFRDPMMQKDHPSLPMQRKCFNWIEKQSIERCTKAVFTTEGAMESYKARYDRQHHVKFTVIQNGYDEEALEGYQITASKAPCKRRITLLHSGALYSSGRDPSTFFRAIANLKGQSKVSSDSLRIILRAPGELQQFRQLAERFGIADIVEVEPPIAYKEALLEMLSVDGLLVFQGSPFNQQIPAKVYEYFWARKPLMGLVDFTGETARLLIASGYSSLASLNDSTAITSVLENFLNAIRDGSEYVATENLLKTSSRKGRANELAEIFSVIAAV